MVAYSIATTDTQSNAGTTTGLSVVVDNTAPSASDVQTTNKVGGVKGAAELGDVITYTYSEPIEPNSIVSGWTGASTNVVVQLNRSLSNDSFQIGTRRTWLSCRSEARRWDGRTTRLRPARSG